jgi:acylpyruvate hydrolase
MKLLTFRTGEGTRAGRLDGADVIELPYEDVGAILAAGDGERAREITGRRRTAAGLDLAPPIVNPGKIICVGLNYLAHIREAGHTPPAHPQLFNKFRRTMIGPRDPIVLPRVSEQVDWEVELAVVIGKSVRHVSGPAAADAIFGWTIMNDTSVRDWQFHSVQPMAGKAWERSSPIGPVVASKDELDASDLRVWTEVDGKIMQDSRTSDLLFKPADIVAYISEFITLDPGDIIATGTPSGVGFARQPQVWLREGQTVTCGVEGIGELINLCVMEGRDFGRM